MKKSKLFEDFEEILPKAWKQKIQSDLRGADYNETLIWTSPEGISVKPFYQQEDIENIGQLDIHLPEKWYLGQAVYVANAKEANKKALDIVSKGVESLVFTIISEQIEIKELLKNIDLFEVAVHLDLQFLSPEYISAIKDSYNEHKFKLYIHSDTIGNLARSGNWYDNLKEDQLKFATITTKYPALSWTTINSALYQNAGANIIQQLAYGLAHANEYLNLNSSQKQHPGLPQQYIFKTAIGGNYFFEIAKLRAIRWLWTSLTAEYGIKEPCHIMAFPSRRNKTIYDYNTNMLRSCMESMAAILGGADTVCNLPYDSVYHKDNDFGERIARNQLLILKHESHFDKVTNPVDGTYYIEKITSQLAQKALVLFKEIEAGGGFLKQLKDHNIQKKIRESAQKEAQLFKEQKEVLVGTNVYQNPADTMKDELQIYPFVKINRRKTLIEPIIESRLSEVLEQERLGNE